MGKAIRASVLILLLACSARAGWMQNGAPAPPPPSEPTSAPAEATTEGQSDTPPLVEIALTLFGLF